MNDRDDTKKMFNEAGFICLRLSPIKYRVRGEDGYIDVFPVLGKWKGYAGVERSDDLVATALAMLTPYPPCVSPELIAHRERLAEISADIHRRVCGRPMTEV